MKLTPALALLALATPALAQTSSTAHHTSSTATAHRPASSSACGNSGIPPLGAAIPKVAGCPKTLYALKYIDTVVGTGPLAMPMKLYTVNYTGYLTNGTKFDSSVDRKDPIIFPAGFHRVITGWDTGFEGMHVGGKRRLFIPYELAYGEAGKPPTIPEKAMLVFDVELIAQADLPQQPPQQPGQPGQRPGATPSGAPPQPRPATPPASATPPTNPAAPPPTPGAIPAPSTTPKPPVDPAKPATVPPPTDPTKPTTVPPPSSTSPSNQTSSKQ
jgi:peptidylprolyl isomerase